MTTPALAGARARQTKRDGLELIVPRGGAGQATYGVRWRSIADFCQPSVHDTRLLARVGRLAGLSPGNVRQAMWDAAAEGFAGRAAREAALAAVAAEDAAHKATQHQILTMLVEQMEARGLPLAFSRTVAPTALAGRAVARLATELTRRRADVEGAIEGLAVHLAAVGLRERVGVARLPRQLAAVQAFHQDIRGLEPTTERQVAVLDLIQDTTSLALACAAGALGAARGRADEMTTLIRLWLTDPLETAETLERADWLLDGWGWICHLWSLAGSAAERMRALEEIVPLLPPVPRAVAGWPGCSALPRPASLIPPETATATATALEATWRNEQILALAA